MKSIYDLLDLKLKLQGIFHMEHTYYKMWLRQLKHMNKRSYHIEIHCNSHNETDIGMASFFTFAAPRTQVTDSAGGSGITTERPVQKRPL